MGFDGPLDLLLFLIRRHELDILDIPMALICREYLAYMKAMEEVDIDVAAEFLFMASELIHIKSRCLLPQSKMLSTKKRVTQGLNWFVVFSSIRNTKRLQRV